MEQSTMSAGATMQSPPAQDVPSTPIHPITWPLSCFTPAKAGNGTYQGSVLAASLTPGAADIWSAAHHQWKQSQAGGEDQAAALGHDDSGISPGRTSSSGPSSVGGSPPAAKTAETLAIKEEQPEKDQEMSIHDEDSFSSEDAVDPYGRGSHPSSPNGQPAVHLRCPFCGSQDFDSIEHMLEHCRAHTDTGPPTSSLNCSVCSLASVTKEAFLTHLASHLPQQHHCLLCGFATKSSPKLRAHLAEVHGVDPAETNNEISTRGPAQGKVKSFKCKQCMFVAHTKLDFWAHSKEHIKGDKVLSCPRCPFVTEYKHHLEYHLRNHSGSKPFKCPQCPYTCVNKSMLNSHLKSHSNVYQYRCADCNYVTKYCHSLKLHLRKYLHNPAMVLNPDGTPNPLPIIDVYGTRRGPKLRKELELQAANAQQSTLKCPQCDFQSMSESHIQQHMLSVHPQPPPQAQQQQQPPQQQQQAPMNPLKEYLSWMYAQQMGLMHHFSTTAALTSNPLDLRKEQPQQPASPSHSPAKSRRKTKAPYRLLEQSTEQEERVASPIAAQPPPPVVQPEAKKPEEKMLSCSYCDIFFKDAVMYAMHMGYHGYKDPFHCNMCGEKTQDRLSFFLHIARSSHL